MSALLAAAIAVLLTVFDMDRTFYLPKANPQKAALYAWMGAFVAVNAALAAGTYAVIRDVAPFEDWHSALTALAAGAGYLAIIHAKITTFSWQGGEVPFGFELLYQGGKNYVYKRINRIAKRARATETQTLANDKVLAELAQQARLAITQDALLTSEEKQRHKEWLLSVLNDTSVDDMDKRLCIANYILSEERTP